MPGKLAVPPSPGPLHAVAACAARRAWLAAWWWAWLLVGGPAFGAESTLRVRLVWGGGEARAWQGEIALRHGTLAAPRALGLAPDQPGSMWLDLGRLRWDARLPHDFDGVDLTAQAELSDTLLVTIQPRGEVRGRKTLQIPLSELVSGGREEPLDDRGNRLQARRAPGGCLEVESPRRRMIFAPGEALEFVLRLNHPGVADGAALQVQMRLESAAGGEPLWSESQQLQWREASNPWLLPVRVPLPEDEGVYHVRIDLSPDNLRQKLGLKRTLASRKLQCVVLRPEPPMARPLNWELETEMDVSQPSWWQRVSKLPVPQFPVRSLPVPSLPLPDLSVRWGADKLRSKSNKASAPQGVIEPRTTMHALGRLVQLPPSDALHGPSWSVYPLALNRPGRPHLLEVEYPSDTPQSLLVSVLETSADGKLESIGADSAFVLDDQVRERRPVWLKHRVIFWPRSSQVFVAIANPSARAAAAFGKLRVLSGAGRLPMVRRTGMPGRTVWAYLEKPHFNRLFSAVEEFDAWNNRGFESWTTFYQGGSRLVEYLRYAGYSGCILGVAADGSALYESDYLEPTPRFDGGIFFTEGHDPYRKDVLELLLLLFDREGLEFVPAIDFSAPLPELEAELRAGGPQTVGMRWVDGEGAIWQTRHGTLHGLAPHYNVLHPRVQEAMLRVVRELARRCAGHASFAGLAVQLWAQGYAQLPGPEWGLDDATVSQFEQATGIRVPASDGNGLAARRKFLLETSHREAWLAWRADALTTFYRAMAREVEAVQPSAKLYLAGARLCDGPQWRERLRPSLRVADPLPALLLEMGLDVHKLNQSRQVVFLPPAWESPLRSVGGQFIDFQLEQTSAWDAPPRGTPLRAALVYRPAEEYALHLAGQQSPATLSLATVGVPSDEYARRYLARAVAARDVQTLVDGGWQLPLGQEDALRELRAVLSQLPAEPFQNVQASTHPVVVRALAQGERTFIYAVNDSPWPARLLLRLNLPTGVPVVRLGAEPVVEELPRDEQGAVWNVELRPYDLAAICVGSPRAAVREARTELEPTVADELERLRRDLSQRVAALREARPQGGSFNGGFDQPLMAGGGIPGWTLLAARGTSAALDHDIRFAGEAALRLHSDGAVAVLVSDELTAPRTGRIAVSLRVRVADAAHQPTLRLAIEGEYHGRPYVRPTVLGRGGAPLDSRWGYFLFALSDLPFEGLSPLRLRFELLGPGEAWIDSVEISELPFDDAERVELAKMLTLASLRLEQRREADCYRVLSSYWPRYLLAYVPPLDDDALQGTSPTPVSQGAAPAPAASKPPAAEPQGEPREKGWRDRFRRWLPDLGK